MKHSAEWWKTAKRRAYTYQEKKINRLDNYSLYKEIYGVQIDVDALREILIEEQGRDILGDLSERKLNRVITTLQDDRTREEYDQVMEEEDILHPFSLTIELRDHAPINLTTSEARVIAHNYIYRFLEQAKQGTLEKDEEGYTDALQEEILQAVIKDFHGNWIYYMDTLEIVRGKTVDILNEAKARKRTIPNITI